ncbi:hypothetical protein GF380_03360, partial [Candidatus Uhrbacteria bacterium]|nr:hypothetical protein [Candidatus Uhrbacteria bacterium]MBD3284173.1 hypothetical protein [Candidatus Uhrbacteria bacterium]
MKTEVIPAINAKNRETFQRRLKLIAPYTRVVQVDVMDGKFVKQTTWHNPKTINDWNIDTHYELHLMVEDPISIIQKWKNVRGFKRAIVHAEAPKKLGHLVETIRGMKLQAGVAISPGTPIRLLNPIADRLDMILVMGGKPGKSG